MLSANEVTEIFYLIEEFSKEFNSTIILPAFQNNI